MVEKSVDTTGQLSQRVEVTPVFDIPSIAQELAIDPNEAKGFLPLFKKAAIAMQMLAKQREAAWAETPEATIDAAKELFWLILNNGDPTPEAQTAFHDLCLQRNASAVEHALNALENSYRHPEPKIPDEMRDARLARRIDELRQGIIASVVETKQHLLDNGALKGWNKDTMKDLIFEAAKKGMVEV